MTASFDPQLGSLSDHDTRIQVYTETKYHAVGDLPLYIKITL